MPPKKTPAPIDRPLSRAYLRQFKGWSTAYPPGMSEPNSVRLMENVMVDRNGGMVVRPGLHCLTFSESPDIDPIASVLAAGTGLNRPVVGGPEVFYTNDGQRALLIAVHNYSSVEFRAIKLTRSDATLFELTDPEIGFSIPDGMDNLAFSSDTRHVEFLQLDNKIVALSDRGEPARLFHVGPYKTARVHGGITFPRWTTASKLTVIHPNEPYINASRTLRHNLVQNPSFEVGTLAWTVQSGTGVLYDGDAYSGGRCMVVESAPLITNLQPAPLHDAQTYGWQGWAPGDGAPALTVSGDWHVITGPGWADGSKAVTGVGPNTVYRLGIDIDPASTGAVSARATAYSGNGAIVGSRTVPLSEFTKLAGPSRWQSPEIRTPDDTVAIRVSLGVTDDGWAGFQDLMLTDGFGVDMIHGDSGTDTYWTGAQNLSASVYHPPQQVTVLSTELPYSFVNPVAASIAVKPLDAPADWDFAVEMISWSGVPHTRCSDTGTALAGDWSLAVTGDDLGQGRTDTEHARLRLRTTLARGERVLVDAGLLEQNGTATPGDFFSGNSPAQPASPGPEVNHYWQGEPQFSISVQETYPDPQVPPIAATPTANTLISSTAGDNVQRMGFFYTFEGPFGESAPSQVTEIAMQRDRAGWRLETPNAQAEPSGTPTDDPLLAADQLVAIIPGYALQRALGEGALRANLYTFAWSDQGVVPSEGYLEGTIDLYSDPVIASEPQSDSAMRHFRITARRTASDRVRFLPVEGEENASAPPGSSNGIVAADRMILVGDPARAASVRWTSGDPSAYLNFSAYVGGGEKTLSTGNLNIPLAVELWQNPQSVDTLTVLCSDDNGRSRSYYMQPAQAASGSGGSTTLLSFEETTNSPGTTAPYGAEVLNNALYRPISTELVKSTASNYNINHRSMTDDIENMWFLLQNKEWIMSSQLNNRLYYLVHNPTGETLRPYCVGNEVWVFDVAAKEGVWSRLLIQGNTLSTVRIGSRVYLGIGTDTGFYYLDPMYRQDDVDSGFGVVQQPIPWMFETNTQGANRAHDAWAHLQQVGITLGDFTGTMEYGIRGRTSNGRQIDVSKRVTDLGETPPLGQSWDIEDFLQVRRDLKEWFFYARSVAGEYSGGQVALVQYRYTPVSVNVGYEYGSVETFEYGAPDSGYARNGIPLPYLDYNRP